MTIRRKENLKGDKKEILGRDLEERQTGWQGDGGRLSARNDASYRAISSRSSGGSMFGIPSSMG
ncbi:MAG: hypothetical protein METHAR1v1_10008 [Methanothrix sp.]|nr:MAG: hypothetical protein METHAR1v1_10008 [Methanothrix sp.]